MDSLFSAAAVKRLSCHGTPLFSVSGRQRSNTLYFACKVCANRVLRAPIGNPAPRGFSPLDTPLFLTAKRYPNHKNRFGTHAVKNKKSEKYPRGGLEKFRILSMGACCGFAISHGGATVGTWRKLPTCALLRLSPIFINDLFITDFYRRLFVACFYRLFSQMQAITNVF